MFSFKIRQVIWHFLAQYELNYCHGQKDDEIMELERTISKHFMHFSGVNSIVCVISWSLGVQNVDNKSTVHSQEVISRCMLQLTPCNGTNGVDLEVQINLPVILTMNRDVFFYNLSGNL